MHKKIMLSTLCALMLTAAGRAAAMPIDDETKVFDSYALEKQGDYPGAIKKMTSVLEHNSDSYVVNLRLGWLFSLNKKYKNAISHYEKAAELSPASVEPLLALSLLHTTLGDYSDAADVSEQLLSRDAKNYLGLVRLISAKIQMKDFGPALAKVEVAAKLYPADPVFLEQEGFIQMQVGKTAEARKTLTKLLLVAPGNPYAHSVLGEAMAH